jgi:hypothetical protein
VVGGSTYWPPLTTTTIYRENVVGGGTYWPPLTTTAIIFVGEYEKKRNCNVYVSELKNDKYFKNIVSLINISGFSLPFLF